MTTTSPPPLDLMEVLIGAVKHQLTMQTEAARLDLATIGDEANARLAVCVHEAGRPHLLALCFALTLYPGAELITIRETARRIVADALAVFIPTLAAG